MSYSILVPYTELTFEFNNNTKLFDDLDIFKSVCKLEWSLRALYTNCSTSHLCCQFIGPGKKYNLSRENLRIKNSKVIG
jgi:hypothetical protein